MVVAVAADAPLTPLTQQVGMSEPGLLHTMLPGPFSGHSYVADFFKDRPGWSGIAGKSGTPSGHGGK